MGILTMVSTHHAKRIITSPTCNNVMRTTVTANATATHLEGYTEGLPERFLEGHNMEGDQAVFTLKRPLTFPCPCPCPWRPPPPALQPSPPPA